MIPRSKIYLKGIREPLILHKEKAIKVESAFLDTSVPSNQPFSSDGKSFLKDMIKGIEIISDVSDDIENGINPPFWVIYSPSRNTIWGKTYISQRDAELEVIFQESNGDKGDWVILKQ